MGEADRWSGEGRTYGVVRHAFGGRCWVRRGELIALEQTDIRNGAVHIVRNEWMGKVGTLKGGTGRSVPLTNRLAKAVEAISHLRGKRLLSARPVPGTAAGWSATHRPARKGTGRLPEHALYDLRSRSRSTGARFDTRGTGGSRS